MRGTGQSRMTGSRITAGGHAARTFGGVASGATARLAAGLAAGDPVERARGMTAGAWLAGAVAVLALPSAVLAFTANFASEQTAGQRGKGVHAAIGADEGNGAMSGSIPFRSLASGPLYAFTPAVSPNRPDRSVTVAVRVGLGAVKAITVRGNSLVSRDQGDAAHMPISPTGFNLGVSRGYRNFAGSPGTPAAGLADISELRKYSLQPSNSKDSASRFSPRLASDDKPTGGRAPRTFSGDPNDVDLGGAYRLTDHIDVTAGVRYSQDRDRIAPLTDGKQDNQAVYVGTQFRF